MQKLVKKLIHIHVRYRPNTITELEGKSFAIFLVMYHYMFTFLSGKKVEESMEFWNPWNTISFVLKFDFQEKWMTYMRYGRI